MQIRSGKLIFVCCNPSSMQNWGQADGALGEPSDKSDFSLHVWDSFSQEIRDLLFIFYGQKSLIYLKCSDFLPKKEEMCYFFIEKREKQNKRRKKS